MHKYINVCTCIHVINVKLKIRRTAISTTKYNAMPSQRGQSSPNILTTGTPWLALTGEIRGVFCELKVWFHIPYQSPQFCIQSEVYIPPRYDGTPLCVPVVPPLRGRSSCSRQEREICTDNIADGMQHHKIRECFSMAMSSKDLLCFANKSRCIQSCDILHMQNIASVYNHWRLIVNISNKRFLILILILIPEPMLTRISVAICCH